MARAHGKNTVFKIDDAGGTLRDISNNCDNVAGLPGAAALSEVTAYGDNGERFIRGIQGLQFTVSGNFDSAATTGTATVLNSIRTALATSTFEYGPEGGTTGKIKYTGECWLEELKVDSAVKEKVPFNATFRLDDGLTITAF